ncbi:ABC transporter permease [Clostridia bacterium]|nr:ABC transporter permease [Clostridia bacterium]
MILLKQALRSIWRSRRSYIACVMLMTIGIAVYVSFNLLFVNLNAAMNSLYREERFGDGFAVVSGIPLSAAQRIKTVPGIAETSATIVADARVKKDGDPRIITLRLSSFEPGRTEGLNRFVLTAGSIPADGEGVLLGDKFAKANRLKPGDAITLILGGREFSLPVAGLAQSPEYVYAIPDTGQLMPDDEAFGFGYLSAERLGILTGKSGFATNLSFILEEGASFSSVKPLLEDMLSPYGLSALFPREDHPSHAMLKQEIDSLGAMATSLPMTFIAMATVILYIMLKRIIEQERMQIGTLKAFGFSDRAILGHYLMYGGVTGVAGGLLGIGAGVWMTGSFTLIYLDYFSLPAIQAPPDVTFLLIGLGIALCAGLMGAFMGTRGILRLDPAEAMRPSAPPGVHGDILGKLPFMRAVLASHGYMAARNITRNRFRSAFVVLGIALSFALTAFMSSFSSMFDALLMDQFTKVEVYNLKISMKAPSPYTQALEAAWRMGGVRRAEAMLELPAELSAAHLKENVGVTALEAGSSLYKIYDSERKINLEFPPGGVVISHSLADKLRVGRGGLLTMKTPYTGDTEYALPILEVIHTNLGMAAYMRIDSLWALLDIPPSATALLLDASRPEEIKAALLEAGQVSAITDQEQTKRVYAGMVDTYSSMVYMLRLAGLGIAFAIITNTSSISLSERKREYATMRVLGMHPREIGRVISFEYWLLAAVSLPFGLLLTKALGAAMSGMINNDIFSVPTDTPPASFFSAAAICGLAILLSNLSARRKIAGFDMVEVLKERE